MALEVGSPVRVRKEGHSHAGQIAKVLANGNVDAVFASVGVGQVRYLLDAPVNPEGGENGVFTLQESKPAAVEHGTKTIGLTEHE